MPLKDEWMNDLNEVPVSFMLIYFVHHFLVNPLWLKTPEFKLQKKCRQSFIRTQA